MTIPCRSMTPPRVVPYPATHALHIGVRLNSTSCRPRLGAVVVGRTRATKGGTGFCAALSRSSLAPVGSYRTARCLTTTSAMNFRLPSKSSHGLGEPGRPVIGQQKPFMYETDAFKRPVPGQQQQQQQPIKPQSGRQQERVKIHAAPTKMVKLNDIRWRINQMLEENDDPVTAEKWKRRMQEHASDHERKIERLQENHMTRLKQLQEEHASKFRELQEDHANKLGELQKSHDARLGRHLYEIKTLTERLRELENQPDGYAQLKAANQTLKAGLDAAQALAASLETSHSAVAAKYRQQSVEKEELMAKYAEQSALLKASDRELETLQSQYAKYTDDMQKYVKETEQVREMLREEQHALQLRQARAKDRLTYSELRRHFDDVFTRAKRYADTISAVLDAQKDCQTYWVRARQSFEAVQRSLLDHSHQGGPDRQRASTHSHLSSIRGISDMLAAKVTDSTLSLQRVKSHHERFLRHMTSYQRHAHYLRRTFLVRYRSRHGSRMTSTRLVRLVAEDLAARDKDNFTSLATRLPVIPVEASHEFALLGHTIQSLVGLSPNPDTGVSSHLSDPMSIRTALLVWSFASIAPHAEQIALYHAASLRSKSMSTVAAVQMHQLASMDKDLSNEYWFNQQGKNIRREARHMDNAAFNDYENAVLVRCRAQRAAGKHDPNELAAAQNMIAKEWQAAKKSARRLKVLSTPRVITLPSKRSQMVVRGRQDSKRPQMDLQGRRRVGVRVPKTMKAQTPEQTSDAKRAAYQTFLGATEPILTARSATPAVSSAPPATITRDSARDGHGRTSSHAGHTSNNSTSSIRAKTQEGQSKPGGEQPGTTAKSVDRAGANTRSKDEVTVVSVSRSDPLSNKPPTKRRSSPFLQQETESDQTRKQHSSQPSVGTIREGISKLFSNEEARPNAFTTTGPAITEATVGESTYRGRMARRRAIQPRAPNPVMVKFSRMFAVTKPLNTWVKSEESIPVLNFQLSAERLEQGPTQVEALEGVSWSHMLYRSTDGQSVGVEYCTNKDWAQQVAQKFLQEPILGFDIEWEPYRPKNLFNDVRDVRNNVSLVQLAAEDKIALFHISQFAGMTVEELIPPALQEILTSSSIVKAGVNIAGDASRMEKWLGIECKGLFELSQLYRVVMYSRDQPELVSRRLVSLDNQVEDVLGYPLSKGPVRMSSWSGRLTREQRDYAAADAYAGFRLYHALDAARLCMDPVPPRPAFRELNQPILLANGKVPPKPSRTPATSASNADVDRECSAPDTPVEQTDKEAASEVEEGGQTNLAISEPQAPASSPPVPDPRLEAADRWIEQYRAHQEGSGRRTAPARKASLRAYHLWHEAGMAPDEVASLLRTPPLQLSTVRGYIAEAVMWDRSLGCDGARLKEVVLGLPPYAAVRYKGLLGRTGLDWRHSL